jgi:lipopolysaccharide biosynthesis regulator YciM
MNPSVYIAIIVVVLIAASALFMSLQRRTRKLRPEASPYTDGLNLLVNGDLTQAAQKFREAAQQDTSNVDAYLRLGNIYRDTGNVQRAIKIHNELTLRSNLTPAQRLEVYKMLALDYLKAENVIRALEYVDMLLSQNKKDHWALDLKRTLLEQRKDFHGAFELEKKVQDLDGIIKPERLALMKAQEGIELYQQGKGRDARLRFREAIKILPGCAPAYLYWAESYIKEERVQDAVNVWGKFIKANPSKAYLAFKKMESVLFDLGRFGEMEQYYRNVLENQPGNVHAIVALARLLFKMGESTAALDTLKEGLERNPDSLWIRRNLILIYAELKATDEVVALAQDVLERVMTEEYRFKCNNCGRVTNEPTWFCPVCKSWDSYEL